MDEVQHKRRGGIGRAIGFILLFMVIIAMAAAAAMYVWQQRQMDELNQRIGDLTAQLATAKAQSGNSTNSPTSTTSSQSDSTYTSSKSVQVKVYIPQSGAKISSPLAVIGQIPGNWSFEANFPVKLLDDKGKVIAEATGQVIGDWMTSALVPFSATLSPPSGLNGNGTLVLQKSNPSGLDANNDSVSIPVKF